MARTVIILAAGEGKRMKSDLPKVLHPLLGRTLVGHVMAAARPLAARTVVVVGHRAELVTAHVGEVAPDASTVLQAEQRGTGHAVRTALDALDGVDGTVLVLNGDVPLLRTETLAAMVGAHEDAGAAATVLAAEVASPGGLGRILRDADGGLAGIVEARDATPEQLAIREINAGIYAFEAAALRDALGKLTAHNAQGEEYLTDVFGLLGQAGRRVSVHVAADADETLGCNDRAELAQLGALLRDRINAAHMRAGVTIVDPATTWIDADVTIERDAVVEPATYLKGATAIAAGAVVGPDVTLVDTTVGAGAEVVRAHAVLAEIGPQAKVGPYAYLRPGTTLGVKSKVGTFVEVKNSTLGEGAKVPHLSYVGDANVGEHTNIGAANVVANYNWQSKSRTIIGAYVNTGSDSVLVAPVRLGDGSTTAAGSIITEDVPPGALAIARERQVNKEGWIHRARPDSAAAAAAKAAAEADGGAAAA
ncbi:bifunctional UDP-N-acetylglucosamine diphosphorylase/glucosamine-1-phosphate N-acetyltransferase GlmU [Hamadaea tsunoensis]|uniref:bifunctional UDP-N-acetylglucosamine diphosphorylase/glucosamine-1-phosphate N-acetyltransferase GlmU n=1 Tax=Hamadaea tsunoensis TaxID=53368 RepID=UPI00040AA8DD|nr:bifunctional UDP-N-acetylglucosamine diphosphorylase/glucosamine-1-phosphate N-acetyltransferase GlmU [Hamadaea tsunoensis]